MHGVACDWYQGTVQAPVDDVLDVLLCDLVDFVPELRHARGHNSFAHQTFVHSEGVDLGSVMHGGQNPYPHFLFTGDQAPRGMEVMRKAFPVHYPSRMDAAADYVREGAYDELQGHLVEVARLNPRLKRACAGDHLVDFAARSFSVGARASAAAALAYDKSAEQRAKYFNDPARLIEVPDHWARLEARIRPQDKAARERVATLEPVDVFGASAWLRDLWKRISGNDLQPVQVRKPWRQVDDERGYLTLLDQYGPLLRRRLQDHGSWSAVGAQLGDDLAALALAKRRMRTN